MGTKSIVYYYITFIGIVIIISIIIINHILGLIKNTLSFTVIFVIRVVLIRKTLLFIVIFVI